MTTNYTVLVVEEDLELSSLITAALREENFDVLTVHDGRQALGAFVKGAPNAVVMALELDGGALLKKIRQTSDLPIIVMTSCSLESSLCNAFALGASDFVRKPFALSELTTRLRTRLREAHYSRTLRAQPTILGRLLVDWARAEIFQDGQQIFLTPREFKLLQALYHHQGQVLTRPWLLERVWGHHKSEDYRLIDAMVKRLRRKVGHNLVQTVRGLGFRLAPV